MIRTYEPGDVFSVPLPSGWFGAVRILTYKLFLLDSEAHGDASDKSDDGFLYARCAVVASGLAYYERVLADPAKMPNDREFEELLVVAALAYERKTGESFDYRTACSYETGSNPTGWPDD